MTAKRQRKNYKVVKVGSITLPIINSYSRDMMHIYKSV